MKKVGFLIKEGYFYQVDLVIEYLKSYCGFDIIKIPLKNLNNEINLSEDQLKVDIIVTIHSIGKGLSRLFKFLKEKNIPTLTIQDGIIDHTHCWLREKSKNRYRPILTDKIAVMGNFSRGILEVWNNKSSSIVETGIPRLDYLSKLKEPAKSKQVLLTCANTPFYDERSKQSFKEIMLEIIKELEYSGLPYIVRLSNNIIDLLDNEVIKNKISDLSNKSTLKNDLENSSVVLTTMSTVAVEAMACNRPTVIINPNNQTQYIQTPWTISNKDHINGVVLEIQSVPKEKMLFQRYILSQHLSNNGIATQKVCELIEIMVS